MKQRDIEILILRYNLGGYERRTLQSIGDRYDIGRESVRQIVKKSNRKFSGFCRRYKNSELLKLKLFTNKLLRPGESEFEKRFVLFLIFGFESLNINVLITLLTELIFGKEYEENIKNTYNKYIYELNRKIEADKKMENQINVFNKRIKDKIIWFSKVKNLNEEDYIKITPKREVNFDGDGYCGEFYSNKMGKKIQYESQLEKEILSLLEESPKVLFYVAQPFKIPYFYLKQRNYTPDIFCVLDDGKGAVIEVKPTFNMVLELNLQKYYVLRKFCEENGYGMLVTDRYTSIEEFVTYEYNERFEEEMLKRLKNGPIKWRELLILKAKYNISYRDIASIIMKNNLIYSTASFNIEMR
ncbi:sigma factor-like helix-turn-helix DNA-binding protein [Clostridium neuense]|uniref:Sigma factor-like helix-turn-helix DNA-binding protein n=1 Tax=Clostridium neuense TaxID=1728934 RepID=A0ABW8TEK1_9CLOT